MKRMILIIAFSLGLLAGSWLTLPQSEAAAWHCRFPYTVRSGDTLSGIAARVGVSIWYLARINGLWNVHYIYAGQVLCLPGPLAPPPIPQPTPKIPTPTVPSTFSSFDLVVEYTFYPTATYPTPSPNDPEVPLVEHDSKCGTQPPIPPPSNDSEPLPKDEPHPRRWTLGYEGVAGIRRRYCLTSGDMIFSVPTTEAVHSNAFISATNSLPAKPVLWLARSNTTTNSFTYTLVAIGAPNPILQLQLEPTRTITQILKNFPALETISQSLEIGEPPPPSSEPISALLDSNTSRVQLRAELMGIDGTFIPVSIAAIDYQVNITSASLTYNWPGFALQTAPVSENYQLWMAFNEDTNTIGPPGWGWRRYCGGWSGRGWWSRWRWSWWGC